jgi:Domain of unknown function (DUF397)
MDDRSPAVWRKSSRSSAEGANCVEVADLAGSVGVRDSKNLAGAVLTFPQTAWSAFTSAIRTGEFG